MRKYIRNQIVDILDSIIDIIKHIKEKNIDNISIDDFKIAIKEIDNSCKDGLSVERYQYYGQIIQRMNPIVNCLIESSNNVDRAEMCELLYDLVITVRDELTVEVEVKKEILLLPYKASMWNDFNDIYKHAIDDEKCEVVVMPIPYCDRNIIGDAITWQYDGEKFPNNVNITDFSQYDFAKHKPDVIYSYNPDEDHEYLSRIHSLFYSSELRKHTDKLVYVSHYDCRINEMDDSIIYNSPKKYRYQPLVSVCIPTYNRCEYLRNSLNSLVNQKEFIEKKVEIVISDNASTDNTKDMLAFYLNKYDNIIYHRNDINIGGGENCKLSTVLGKGTLLKLFSDDFIYNPNSLSFFCNYAEMFKVEKPQMFFSNRIANNCFDGYKDTNFEYYIYSASYFITWIGSYSIWRSDLDKYYDNNIGIEKECWQVQPTLDVLNEKNRGIIIGNSFGGRPFIKNKNINYDLFKVFYKNFLDMLRPYNISGKLSSSCIEWVQRDILLNFMPEWVARQELNVSDWNYYEKSLKYNVENECHNKPYYEEYLKNYNRIYEFFKREMVKGDK